MSRTPDRKTIYGKPVTTCTEVGGGKKVCITIAVFDSARQTMADNCKPSDKPSQGSSCPPQNTSCPNSNQSPCPTQQNNQNQCPSQQMNQNPCPTQQNNQNQCTSQQMNQNPCPQNVNQNPCPSQNMNQNPCSSQNMNQNPCPSQNRNLNPCPSQQMNQSPCNTTQGANQNQGSCKSQELPSCCALACNSDAELSKAEQNAKQPPPEEHVPECPLYIPRS